MDTKRRCSVEGCTGFGRNKGFYKGKTRYDHKCEKHHKISTKQGRLFYKYHLKNLKCESCGWDKSYCDRHRMIPEKGYTAENVKILCPNCHRLFHAGLLKL